ncbi:MAG: CRISPR-associated protein Cas4 [Oscillospiraceae bacterium]
MYAEENFLALSGLQHFAFCRRQWALIHIEQAWQENLLTTEGGFLHDRVHKADLEKRRNIIIVRSMPVFSSALGIRGVCDVVEFHRNSKGVVLHDQKERYRPVPVEYKRGRPKEQDADLLQLCAQAMCLEEMLACDVPEGFIFYGETRRRLSVLLDNALRNRVKELLEEMHLYYRRGHTPKAKPSKSCRACSLVDLCLPKLVKKRSTAAYIQAMIGEVQE